MSDAYAIVTNQFAPHPSTESCAKKHANTNYSRPYSPSQLLAFKTADHWALNQGKPLILDSGCGTGESTFWLSEKFSDCAIVGVDQSFARLEKAQNKLAKLGLTNVLFVRARLEDFWRLAHEAKWPVQRHYLLYPNPWPKAHHHQRRWHGHPVFPTLLKLSPYLEVRSNWLLYLQEFAMATRAVTGESCEPDLIENPEGVTAFERKYRDHMSPCYALKYVTPH